MNGDKFFINNYYDHHTEINNCKVTIKNGKVVNTEEERETAEDVGFEEVNANAPAQNEQSVEKTEIVADVVEEESANENTVNDVIMEYVGRLKEKVPERWKDGYEQLWRQIIADPSVAAVIYNKGKQQNTTFNRKLVANIIHYLAQKGVYDCDSATVFAKALEGNKDHSVRAELGNNPEDKKINKALEAILVAK